MFERPMQLDINGSRVLTDFDVVHAAQDARKAVDRAFRNIVPNAEGRIVLHFTGGWNPRVPCGEAMVQAIEVLPERRRPIRIDAGNEAAFADWNGVIWDADTGFDGGTILTSPSPVTQASPTLLDQQLYRTARSGKTLQYSFAISPGLYTVHLKFAELWLPDKVGQRPMDIEINGRVVWKAWDPSAAAGQAGMAADLRVEEITPDSTGHITIGLRAAGSHDAILQAIEIE
jgi:hypothetical protein